MSSATPQPMVFGYARISTTTQDESLQLDALDAAGCDRLMIDRASGAAARARGRTGGRPTVWTPEKLAAARSMHASGEYDVATIARILGVSRASVYRALSCWPRPEDAA